MAVVLCSTSRMGLGNQFSWIFFLLAVFQPGMFLDAVCIPALQKPFAHIMERMKLHGQVRNAPKWVLLLEPCVREWMKKGNIYLWCLRIFEIQKRPFRLDTSRTDMHCSFFKSQTLWSVKLLESNIFVQFFSWSFLKKFCWVLHSYFCLTVKKFSFYLSLQWDDLFCILIIPLFCHFPCCLVMLKNPTAPNSLVLSHQE